MSGTAQTFESDEELDLTDTKLLVHDDNDDDDDELRKYIDIPENVTSPGGDYIESFRFIPLTSASTGTQEETVVASKEAPIVLLSDTDSDVVEIDLNSQASFHSDPPDYESPIEDEKADVTHPNFQEYNQDSQDDVGYNELLEMCGQVVGDVDGMMDYDANKDSDDYHSGNTPCKTITHFKRKSPYSVQDRNVKGKGKQPVSGACRFKSSKQKSPGISDTDQDVVCTDSARPICFGDGPADLNMTKVEEKAVIPPPALFCEACIKETSHNSMVQCCDGHMVCMRCVETSAKKVLVGEKKGSVECPYPDCTSSVPLSELRKALPAIVLDLLEDKWNKETMEALENMKDAVKCPGCNFPAVLDLSIKRFQCVQCNEAYCRYCDKKWTERKTHDLCIKTKQWTSTVTGNVVNIPAQWSDPDTDSLNGKTESYKIVELDPSSAEFCDVVHFMNKKMASTVKKIFRVQNERLWEKYSLSRSHMVADLGELNINEKRLFHGTHSDVIEAICKEGFDWRLCGKHGTVYGQGTYFAKSPVLSHRYSSGNLSRRGGQGTGLFWSARPLNNFKPPLRFGAPISTQSGFTMGEQPTTSGSHGFTFGLGSSVQTGNPSFGCGTSQTGASFLFGLTRTSKPVTGFTNQTTKTCNSPIFRSSVPRNVTPLPHPNIFPSSHIQSSTSSDPSSAIKTSCSNCIFCLPKRKANDSCSSTTVVSQPTMFNPVSTGTARDVQSVINNNVKGNTGAYLLVRAVPPSSVTNASSVSNLTFGGNVTNSGSGFPFNNSSGSGSQLGGSSGSTTGHGSGGFTFGIFRNSNSESSDNDCFMFLARVLVGRSCMGSHEMRRPQKNINGDETHSAVDDQNKPRIFVIFDNNQCYPEYVIQYSTSSSV